MVKLLFVCHGMVLIQEKNLDISGFSRFWTLNLRHFYDTQQPNYDENYVVKGVITHERKELHK